MVNVIEALTEHPQLEKLELCSMNIGRNECTALANLLNHSFTELHTLSLHNNRISDEGVCDLVEALANSRSLSALHLSPERSKGGRAVGTNHRIIEHAYPSTKA